MIEQVVELKVETFIDESKRIKLIVRNWFKIPTLSQLFQRFSFALHDLGYNNSTIIIYTNS